MALVIKSIPVLKAEVASKFVNHATANYSKRATIDFSIQVLKANKIFEKSKYGTNKLI